MALTTVGALCLAMLFASLSRRMPADGGPYAYARAAFGNLIGFSNAWLYWIPAWAGNAAIATGWVLYVERFVNTGHGTVGTVVLTLAGIWAAAAINLRGIRSMGQIQLWTSVIKFLPLLAMSTIGLFFIDLDNFTPFNLSGQAALPAIGSAMALCLFSYIGVESASVAAAKVSNPTRNVPRATIFGTLASASVYLLSLVAIFGILPNVALSATTAPFATAAETISGASWVGALVAFLVVVSGFGALNGWTMLAAEVPLAASKDGLFPERFQRLSSARRAGLRHRRLRDPLDDLRAALARRRDRHHRVQHPRADDRHRRRHPVRVLRPGADQVAHRRRAGDHPRPARARPGRRRRLVRRVGAVHRLLRQHRRRGLRGLRAVLLRARRLPARGAGLPDEPDSG